VEGYQDRSVISNRHYLGLSLPSPLTASSVGPPITTGDFGLSTVRSNRKRQHQTAVGTVGYAAPELLKSKPYNEKSDMYALGCCLYEILTMRSVFDDERDGCFPVSIPSVRRRGR